jgi:flagellar M-ring protein FliF
VLGLFVLKPILSGSISESSRKAASGSAAVDIARPALGNDNLIPLTGEITDENFVFPSSPGPSIQSSTGLSDTKHNAGEPAARLRQLIAERQDETVEILRGWLEDKGERV